MTDKQIDAAADDQQAFDDMMAANRTRRILDDTEPLRAPQSTDFTEIEKLHPCSTDKFVLRVTTDGGGRYEVGGFATLADAAKAELAINQVMIEYRTKRNAWEFDRITQEHKRITASVRQGG